MKIIAITGSIGCGKTYISSMIKSLGYTVFDADKEVRLIYKNNDFLKMLKENFSSVFENGILNKNNLKKLVFNDKNKLKKLENLIYPFLKIKLKEKIRKSIKNSDFLFIDAALIFEMNWDIYCDYVILADVDKNIQKQRVILRDKISEEDFKKIIANQMDNELKKKMSDFVVDTNLSEGIVLSLLIKFISEIA